MEPEKYLTIIRPGNGIIAAIGVFVGYTIATHSITFNFPILLGIISAFLINSAGNAINDYFDSKIDKKMGREKLKNENERARALLYSGLLFAAGIAIAFFINVHALAIAIIVSALLLLYSGGMQNFKLLGNYVVALGTAFTLIYGAAITQNYAGIVLVAGSAFFANVAREIVKDVEDMEGDKGVKLTLPMIVGFDGIKRIVLIAYIAAIIFGIIAFFMKVLDGAAYLVLLAICAALFLYSYMLLTSKQFNKAQKFSKFGMVAALIAFMAGAI